MCSRDTFNVARLLFRRGGVAGPAPPRAFELFIDTIFHTHLSLLLISALAYYLSFRSVWFDPVGVVAFRIFQSRFPARDMPWRAISGTVIC